MTSLKNMNKAIKLSEIQAVIDDCKTRLPAFTTLPITPEQMTEKKILGALVISDGTFKEHTIIIRSLEMSGSDVKIDYVALDKDKTVIEDNSEMNYIVGDVVQYFMALEAYSNVEKSEDI
jgi:hypothetical protein